MDLGNAGSWPAAAVYAIAPDSAASGGRAHRARLDHDALGARNDFF